MILKNPKVMIWVFFVILSIVLIGPNPNPTGVAVTYIGKNSTLTDLRVGDIIYKVNGVDATTSIVTQNFYGDIPIETNKGKKFERTNGTLGIDVKSVSSTNLKFGLDIEGGTRVLIKSGNITENDTLQQIITTLQTRINVYGLRESIIRPVGKDIIEISMAGGTKEELKDLLERQGNFEAKIPVMLDISDGVASLNLAKNYMISADNESIIINGITYKKGETFSIEGIKFMVEDIKDEKLNMTSTVFSGSDIKTVYFDPQRSRIEKLSEGAYRWSFSVQISVEGAKKFAMLTQNIAVAPVEIGSTERYLESKIHFFLDEKPIDALNIAADLKGKEATEVSITGYAATLDQAKSTRSFLQSILRSGALPTSIEIAQMDVVSPNLGIGFLRSAITATLFAALGVVIIVTLRYRKLKLIIPVSMVSLSEIIIILGMSVLIGWTIDLAAIAGIIAAVGTGVDSQIIIIDRALRKEEEVESMKQKIQSAFFIVFGSAGTVIGAMIPLTILGFGMLRGFALTTIMGVLIGILIARPAFGVIVEKLVE